VSDAWSVLVTGPVAGLERWCAAAREVGWEALPFPLLEVVEVAGALDAPAGRAPDWIAVTSASAVAPLAQGVRKRKELAAARFVAVGQATAEEMVAAGLPDPLLPLPGAQDARGLAETLASQARPGERVLWPRGDRARDLAEHLRRAGLEVDDPIVYRTLPVELAGEPPRTDAVFFASPSAVAVWDPPARAFRPAAIAIGWTTYEALVPFQGSFSIVLPLVTPSLHAFQDCLRSFAPSE